MNTTTNTFDTRANTMQDSKYYKEIENVKRKIALYERLGQVYNHYCTIINNKKINKQGKLKKNMSHTLALILCFLFFYFFNFHKCFMGLNIYQLVKKKFNDNSFCFVLLFFIHL